MRVYQCDCCNKVISDPYTVKMKEFYLGVDTDTLAGLQFLLNARAKLKYIYVMIVSKACMLLPKRKRVKSNGKKTDIDYDCN